MKVVILAGGYGTRLMEETQARPKPMIYIGEYPIIWHIMKIYSFYGFKEFIIAGGYKCEMIKDYFLKYKLMQSDITVNLSTGDCVAYSNYKEDWIVHIIDTGLDTATGGRLDYLRHLLKETFMLTYGDGVANINIPELIKFHKQNKKIATITAVRPPARFGLIEFKDADNAIYFTEKPQVQEGWINGGFMVFEPEVLSYIKDDNTRLEQDVLETLSRDGKLRAYKHYGFWQCVDTLRDLKLLEELWRSGNAPWKIWKD